jgi:hypothetical protein
MTPCAVVVGMLLAGPPTVAEAEPFPAEVRAVNVLSGSGRLVLDGREENPPLVLLPEGVFFTTEGYRRLQEATFRLQDDMGALRRKLDACKPQPYLCPEVPVTVQTGWSTRAVVIALAAGLAAGAGAVVLLR